MTHAKPLLLALTVSVSMGIGAALHTSNPSTVQAAPPSLSQASSTTPPSGNLGTPNIYVGLAQAVMPAVVNISTLTLEKKHREFRTPDEMFEEFFGGRMHPGPAHQSGSLGTGFIIDPSGIILTNQHVVAEADEIRVTLTESPDEKPIQGKVIGRDPELDIALIQIKTDRKLVSLPLGDSDALQVGEYVAAVGNPFGQGHSLTHGIISAKGRTALQSPLTTYLQTDAPINPGNSGGPLINLQGEVIGINNAIDARAQGIGFAIPVNAVKSILPQLKSKGVIARGYMGVVVTELNPEIAEKISAPKNLRAPLVTEVAPGGPAYRAGIRPYDIITELNGNPIHSPAELTSQITTLGHGKEIAVRINRDSRNLEFKVKLGTRPTSNENPA